jgi:protoporphyrinogen/coproporphyrinogen III oxidase
LANSSANNSPSASARPGAPRIAIVGGGISGLAAAHRITERLPQAAITVFEAADRLGGVLHTVKREGFLVEQSADSFLTKLPWAVDLCRRVGIPQLIPTDESRRRALVARGDELLPVPDGFVLMQPRRVWPLVTTRLLSWRGKARLLSEPFIARRDLDDNHDESVASFATRRLGREAFERLVQPLLAGIYTADAERLSMSATLPEFLLRERQLGSLFRGTKRSDNVASAKIDDDKSHATESGARYSLFVTPREGIGKLVEALASRLPTGTVRTGAKVKYVRRDAVGPWLLAVDKQSLSFDAVILALPTHIAAELLADFDENLSGELTKIEYASCAVVSMAYRLDQFGRPPEGFGFVVPQIENRPIIAASFASQKFPGRAPDGEILIRVFVGGALRPQLVDLPDAELAQLAHVELVRLLRIAGGPKWNDVARWRQSMPQYHVGHLQRVAAIEVSVAKLSGLELAGNAYHGVGIPQCIHSGETAAERIVAWLGNTV